LFTSILAYRLRSLPDRWNEFKPNTMAIYTCTMLAGLWIVLVESIELVPSTLNSIEIILTILAATITILLIYGPKVHAIVTDKQFTLQSMLNTSQYISPVHRMESLAQTHKLTRVEQETTVEKPEINTRYLAMMRTLTKATAAVEKLTGDLAIAEITMMETSVSGNRLYSSSHRQTNCPCID
jgi:hypothetical protein